MMAGDNGRPPRTFGRVARCRLAAIARKKPKPIAEQGDKAYRGECAVCQFPFVVCSPLDPNSPASETLPPMIGDVLECETCGAMSRVEQVVGFTVQVSELQTARGLEL